MIQSFVLRLMVALLVGIKTAVIAHADDVADRKFLLQIMNGGEIQASEFSAEFTAQIPIAQLKLVLDRVILKYGSVKSITGTAGRFTARTEKNEVPIELGRNQADRINYFFVRPGVPIVSDLSELVAALDKLSGDTAYLIVSNGKVNSSRHAKTRLAVGSTFKLAVLLALKRRIDRGEATWDDVIRLRDNDISLPSGYLHKLPVGSPLTLHTLAALMIAQSDNTATDALIRFLGKPEISEIAGLEILLTTREYFHLLADNKLYSRYKAGGLAERRKLLETLSKIQKPDINQIDRPFLENAEWHISTENLCNLIEQVSYLDVMRINPGLADKANWKRVAYKGGSEQGVLNLTTYLVGKDDQTHCVSVTWNSRFGVDRQKLFGIYRGILREIHNHR